MPNVKDYLPVVGALVTAIATWGLALWSAQRKRRQDNEEANANGKIIDGQAIRTEIWAAYKEERAINRDLTKELEECREKLRECESERDRHNGPHS